VPSQAIDINGGSSWGGWDHRGNSLDVGIWGAGSTTRSYELYTATFAFNNNTFDSSTGGTQVKEGGAPHGFAAGTFSPGAFTNGNTIFGIGLDLNGPANTNGNAFVSFGLGSDNFRPASALGAGDGRVGFSIWGHEGDFKIWSHNNGSGPSEVKVLTDDGTSQGGTGSRTILPGGIGSGVSYDFAFRTFINGGEGGAIQMFFDLTAMQELYNSGGPYDITSRWTNGPGSIGAIGSRFNISIVPEPSSLALVTMGLLSVVAASRRLGRKDGRLPGSAVALAANVLFDFQIEKPADPNRHGHPRPLPPVGGRSRSRGLARPQMPAQSAGTVRSRESWA
jgi:hypothetical protein